MEAEQLERNKGLALDFPLTNSRIASVRNGPNAIFYHTLFITWGQLLSEQFKCFFAPLDALLFAMESFFGEKTRSR